MLSLAGFWRTVLRSDYIKPENKLLAIADEYIAAVPANGVLLPWKLDGLSALQALFRYLAASGDHGPVRAVRLVKHCDSNVYFTDAARKQIKVNHYREGHVSHLEKSGQELFVMECGR